MKMCGWNSLGSAHVSCAGGGVPPSRTFRDASLFLEFGAKGKFAAVEHRGQHARRVRYPELALP